MSRAGIAWALIVGLALGLATLEAAHFLEDPAALFDGLAHDRNHHLRDAQRLAVDLQSGDAIGWLRDVERFRLWPPLHGLIGSLALAVSGLDFRAAVFPSLLGFAMTLVFGFGCARRATGSVFAGLLAFVWIAASPGHHRFAAEVMLESLGAGLSLACLYFFLRVLEQPSGRAVRWLGLCLSLLLLEKYNYYVVVLLGLAGAALVGGMPRPGPLPWRRMTTELRHPLVLLGLALLAGALVVALTGGTRFELAGQSVSIQRPFNLVWAGYVAIFVRMIFVVVREGAVSKLAPPWRDLALWHAAPVAAWFALPRRLGYFLHHISPANSPFESELSARIAAYAEAFLANYHAGTYGGQAGAPQTADPTAILGATVAVGLSVLAAVSWRSLRTAERATIAFVFVAALLTVLHPNAQSRFLHSWIAAFWVVSAVGAHRWLALHPRSAAVLLTVAGMAYGTVALRSYARPAEARSTPSVFAMTDPWLRTVNDGEPVAVVANMPAEELIEWRFVATGGERRVLDVYTPRRRSTPEAREAQFREWLRETPAHTLVFVNVADSSPWYATRFAIYRELETFVERQTDFTRMSAAPAGPETIWESWER